MSDFYLTLPSNSSLETFPRNTLTNFFVKLERSIDLEKYVVGLIELQYPVTWHNVSNAEITVIRRLGDIPDLTYALRDGKYDDIQSLIEEIHRYLTSVKLEKAIQMYQDQITKKVFLINKDEIYGVKFSKNLQNIFGLENLEYKRGIHEGKRQCDIDEGQTALYVYTNIVENQMIGDTMAPLLRVVPLRGSRDDTYRTEEFQHVIYVPTINARTDIVQLDIRRDDGQPVSFQTGKVIATLHFKEVK